MENVRCPVCDAAFPSLSLLNNHLDAVHFAPSEQVASPALQFFSRTSGWFTRRFHEEETKVTAGPPPPPAVDSVLPEEVVPLASEGRRRDLTLLFYAKRQRHLRHVALALTRLENRYAKVVSSLFGQVRTRQTE